MLSVSFAWPALLAKLISSVLTGGSFELDSLNGPTLWPIPGASQI
jgi:hypothetical protein